MIHPRLFNEIVLLLEINIAGHFIYVNTANWIGGHKILHCPCKIVSGLFKYDITPLLTV